MLPDRQRTEPCPPEAKPSRVEVRICHVQRGDPYSTESQVLRESVAIGYMWAYHLLGRSWELMAERGRQS